MSFTVDITVGDKTLQIAKSVIMKHAKLEDEAEIAKSRENISNMIGNRITSWVLEEEDGSS